MYLDAFSGFSVIDTTTARDFYADVVGLDVVDGEMDGLIELRLPNSSARVLVYPKGEAHSPASFTVLNLVVDDIDREVDALTAKGVEFLHYEGDLAGDEKGIVRGTPTIAWFADPAGNVVSLIQADGAQIRR